MLLPHGFVLSEVRSPSDVFPQCPRGVPSGPGMLCPCQATLARAVTLTSLSYIVFWSVTILVPEVLVRLVSCCEGCRVPFLLFLVPFRGVGEGSCASAAGERPRHPRDLCIL